MSLFRHETIVLESVLTPEEFKTRLDPFIESGTLKETLTEYSGTACETSFDLRYLLQPSYVKGKISPRLYGSDINIEVSLTPKYDILIVIAYLVFAFAAFLISFSLVG